MIKNINKRKLSRTSSHRRAMLRNMAVSLFKHEKISTTYAKAKELERFAERLISVASAGTLSSRRKLYSEIADPAAREKIYEVLVPRYEKKPCGRIAVYRTDSRKSDNAEMAVVALI